MQLIPALATIAGVTGVGTLVWYYSKSEKEREALDKKANDLAQGWFDKNADKLNVKEARKVIDEVKKISES